MKVFSIQNENAWIKYSVPVILALFLVLCIGTSLYYGDQLLMGNFESFNNDDVKYLRSAQTLISTGAFTYKYTDQPSVYIMPGIVFIVLPFVKVWGMQDSVMWIRIFQALVQTCTLYILFLIARRVLNAKFALVSLICIATYLPNIYMTTVVFTEVFFLFFFSLLVLYIIYAVDLKETKYYIIGGILWGLCTMFRPAAVTLPIVVLLMWIIKKYTFKQMLKYTLICCICFITVMSPWWIRNFAVFGRFIPFTESSGNPALQGAFYDYKIDEKILDNIDHTDLIYDDNEQNLNRTEELSARRVFAHYFKEDPLRYMTWQIIGKSIENFKRPLVWYPLYGMEYIHMSIHHWVILALAFMGLITSMILKRLNGYGWLLAGLVIYFNCVHLPFYCFPRYVYPVMPYVIMGSILFIFNIMQLKSRQNEPKKHTTKEVKGDHI